MENKIASILLIVVGFLLYTFFLYKVSDIDNKAWVYSIASSFGVLLFSTGTHMVH